MINVSSDTLGRNRSGKNIGIYVIELYLMHKRRSKMETSTDSPLYDIYCNNKLNIYYEKYILWAQNNEHIVLHFITTFTPGAKFNTQLIDIK